MVLLTSAYTPAATTHAAWSSPSAAEVANGNGYTTGGRLLAATVSRSGGTVTFDVDYRSWAAATITAKCRCLCGFSLPGQAGHGHMTTDIRHRWRRT